MCNSRYGSEVEVFLTEGEQFSECILQIPKWTGLKMYFLLISRVFKQSYLTV